VKSYLVNKYTSDGPDRPDPSLEAIVYAYQKLPSNDSVHRLFVDDHVFFQSPSPVPGQREIEKSLPHDFLLAVARVYAQIKVDGEPHPISLRMGTFDFIVHPIA
jgi:hypothetical protein